MLVRARSSFREKTSPCIFFLVPFPSKGSYFFLFPGSSERFFCQANLWDWSGFSRDTEPTGCVCVCVHTYIHMQRGLLQGIRPHNYGGSSYSHKISLFVLVRTSPDWERATTGMLTLTLWRVICLTPSTESPVISFRNTLTDTPRTMFEQISRHPVAQWGWHIKLTIISADFTFVLWGDLDCPMTFETCLYTNINYSLCTNYISHLPHHKLLAWATFPQLSVLCFPKPQKLLAN